VDERGDRCLRAVLLFREATQDAADHATDTAYGRGFARGAQVGLQGVGEI
jgi:hypothetical protein